MTVKLKPIDDQIKTNDKEALDAFLAEHRYLNLIHVYHEDDDCDTITITMKIKQRGPLHYRLINCTGVGDIILHEFHDGEFFLELDPDIGIGGCDDL